MSVFWELELRQGRAFFSSTYWLLCWTIVYWNRNSVITFAIKAISSIKNLTNSYKWKNIASFQIKSKMMHKPQYELITKTIWERA